MSPLFQTWRRLLSYHRLLITMGTSFCLGLLEWIGIGHPLGLLFALLLGFWTLLLSPLPWLWLLPWSLQRSPLQIFFRSLGVLVLSSALVGAPLVLYALVAGRWLAGLPPLVPGAFSFLSSWPAMSAAFPLFTAAGWGLSRHLELERHLDVQDRRELDLLDALQEARLLALQSRLDPHFLFNGLNLVAELCRDDPAEAERCVLRLGSLFRAALDHADRPLITLRQELDLCSDFLELGCIRFGERLKVKLQCPAELDHTAIPVFTLQTLCENAIQHGVERSPVQGLIRVSCSAQGKSVRIRVRSPGPFRGPRQGGRGIDLTRRRLALAFGNVASLSVQSSASAAETVAEVVIPRGEGACPTG